MAIDDVWRVSIVATQFGSELRNVLHFRNRSGSGNIATLAAALRDNVVDGPYTGAVSDTVGFRSIQCRSLIPYGNQLDLNFSMAGTRTDDANANQIAAVVTLKTVSASRRKRGRMYVYGTSVADIDALTGLFTSAHMTRVGALVTALEAYIDETDTDWDLGVWSRINGEELPPFPPTPVIAGFENVTQFIARNNPGTFRTRRIGRGS